jgi:hypothetical protein
VAPLQEVAPPLGIGVAFTAMGLAKVYGLVRGIEGGGGKPLRQRACGT